MPNVIRICMDFMDKFVRYLGPILIVFACVLIGISVCCFYAILLPLQIQNNSKTTLSSLYYLCHIIFSGYIVIMVFFNYFCAIFTDPGTPALQCEALMSQTEQSAVSQRKVCRKCDRLKPERAHHCSVCGCCRMKMCHHCPWINNCVGLQNHRYFYLFMVYLWVGTIYFLFWIWRPFMDVISGSNLEIYGYHNVKWIVLCFMLAATLMFALGGFVAWTSYLVLSNQTTIEFYNNTYEHEAAKSRGQSYRNPYDCGRWMNLRLFFSIGSRYKWWHAFLPVRVRAYSDGYSYLKESQFVQSQLVDLSDFDLDSYNAKLQ